jgi:tetraprenyl-beta-curcumene synthase
LRRNGPVVDQHFVRLLRRFLILVVPQAAARLRRLERRARQVPDFQARRQALASIAAKDFHVYGGCVLATFFGKRKAAHYIDLVATFETAVDYLDNLCDRAGDADEEDFRALHESLLDAVTPRAPLRRYFRQRTGDDGGYLNELVARSQGLFSLLPEYDAIAPRVREVTQRYCDLQALKHLAPGVREQRCRAAFAGVASGMHWWEGAAACGSTLPTFALAFGALDTGDARRASELHHAYFPWISGFHILLDYFIDQAEDKEHAELNFVACYENEKKARQGIANIGHMALEAARHTSDPEHHIFAIQAMCGFYCTHRKIAQQHLSEDASIIARSVGLDLADLQRDTKRGRVMGSLLALYRKAIRA